MIQNVCITIIIINMIRAPEILTRSGHGKAVDWWSLGALMFDMLTGMVRRLNNKSQNIVIKYENSIKLRNYIHFNPYSHHLQEMTEEKQLRRFYAESYVYHCT